MKFQMPFEVRESGPNFKTRQIDQCKAHGIVLVNEDENRQEFFFNAATCSFQ